jgi:hypothetical protein
MQPSADDVNLLTERLDDAASGDAALRQLRRRYDALREDYETLLRRLAELESRISSPEDASNAASTPEQSELADVVSAPLLRLRDGYVRAAEEIAAIIAGLEALAAGEAKLEGSLTPRRPHTVQLDVEADDLGAILDMQERLSALPGIARVSVRTAEPGKALLLVELGSTMSDSE